MERLPREQDFVCCAGQSGVATRRRPRKKTSYSLVLERQSLDAWRESHVRDHCGSWLSQIGGEQRRE